MNKLTFAAILCVCIFPANTQAKPPVKEVSTITITQDEYKNLLIQADKYEKLSAKKKKVEPITSGPVKGDPWQWLPPGDKRPTHVFDDVASKPAKVYPPKVVTKPVVETRSSTPEQAVKHYQLKRDERSDVWVQDIHTPGLWWYGYYSPNGLFVARFWRMNALSDFQSLMPYSHHYYHIRQQQVGVEYLGKISGKVALKGGSL